MPSVLATANSVKPVRQNPAASSECSAAFRQTIPAIAARIPGSHVAVASSKDSTESTGDGSGSPGKSWSSGNISGKLSGLSHGICQPVRRQVVGNCPALALADHHSDVSHRVLVRNVLMDPVVGENASEIGRSRSGISRLRRPLDNAAAHRSATNVFVPGPASRMADDHRITPTRTPLNLEALAPWLVCAICPGWPFPHRGVPQSCQCSGPQTASQLRQNSGVIPV